MTLIVRVYQIEDDPETAEARLAMTDDCERFLAEQFTIDADTLSAAQREWILSMLRSVSLES